MNSKKSVCKHCGKSLKAFNESKTKWEKGNEDTSRRFHMKCYKERTNEYYREIARRGTDYEAELWKEYFIDI